ncbi:hypothetical protein COCON_G00097550 [Conger conger]|uniref:Uncharacterized protein n=1 Tax=Conger conger TaxID=82655 RepID=A0A9Q1DMD3_CONCO|nr:hypothetical protein COCON_G00097550 [Conger conger]
MLSRLASENQRTREDSEHSAPCALWPVDLKLTHVDCSPQDTLVHFQGQYFTICELDYNILQVEIQNAHKMKASVEIGSEIKGYIQGLLPHKVLILEAPAVNKDLLKLGWGKHVDRDSFLLLVEMLTEERICEKSLLIYFRQDVSETQCEVDIVSGGVNVAVELVAAGHATYIDSILGLGLQQGQSPIRAPLKFVPRIVRNTIKFEPEPQPAEAKDALVLAELELDRNAHRPEYADQGNRQTTDDFKSQMSDEAKARQRGEEASADEQFSTERTTRLTEQIPAKGKCIQM